MSVQKAKYTVSTYSDVGDKDFNEDRFTHHVIPAASESENDIMVAGVFDGHGGPQAADFVSENIFIPLWRLLTNGGINQALAVPIEKVFLKIQNWMKWVEWPKWPQSNGWDHSTAGTTASIVVASGNAIYAANCGDSPILVAIAEANTVNAYRVSKDHKPTVALERLGVEERGGTVEEGKVCWPRVDSTTGKIWHHPFLAVTRALGNFWSLHPETRKHVISSVPDVQRYQLPSNSRFIILATDGITDVLSDKAICIKLEQVRKRHENEAGLAVGGECSVNYAREIVLMAKKEWAEKYKQADNMTALVLEIKMEDAVNDDGDLK